jgi:hypothetical protein
MEIRSSVFAHGISQHGYGFQYAVLTKLCELMRSGIMTNRQVVATELPVSYGRNDTRIDIVLRMKTMSSIELMVIECKRVNPKYGAWCFAKSPRPFPEYTEGQLAIESVCVAEPGSIDVETRGHTYSKYCYHIGFALKLDLATGDSHPVSNDRDAIEMACGQVCLGSTGLSHELIQRQYLPQGENHKSFYVLPVVVTTAKLYVTGVDLYQADISTGDVRLSDGEVEERPWIVYQYMLSPSRILEHNRIHERSPDVIDSMIGDAVRSVVIVNADSIGSFTKWYDRMP